MAVEPSAYIETDEHIPSTSHIDIRLGATVVHGSVIPKMSTQGRVVALALRLPMAERLQFFDR